MKQLILISLLIFLSIGCFTSPIISDDNQTNDPGHRQNESQAAEPKTQREPAGLIALKEFDGTGLSPQSYTNPSVSGVALRIGWDQLEPEQGKYGWLPLDDLFAKAEQDNKSVVLILVPGYETPHWALEGVQTASFSQKYGSQRGTLSDLALPWDELYLSRWFSFLEQVATRYGDNPLFVMISATGPTSLSAEMSLPNEDADLNRWIELGYRPFTYQAAWSATFQKYHELFPKQYFSLALYPGLPIDEQGAIDRSQREETRQAVIDLGLRYPQFALQTSGLNAGKDEGAGYDLVIAQNGKAMTGFQMSTSATKSPDKMGDASDPANALMLSIKKGLKENDGHKIRYLEIYEPDILNPSMYDTLRYGATQLSQP